MGLTKKVDSLKRIEEDKLKESLNYFVGRAENFIKKYVQPELNKDDFKKWYDAIKTPFDI